MSPRMAIAAVLIAGMTAGVVVSPVFFVATIVVTILLVNGFRAQNDPAITASDWAAFSPNVGRRLAASLAALPDGDAHRSLLEIGVRARSVLGSSPSTLDESYEQATREHVERLVEACSDSALELSQLEEALAGDNVTVGGSKFDGATRDRLVAARTLLHTRLANAGETLKQLYAVGLTTSSAASERVAELTSELRQDASARRAALAELSQVLDSVRQR